MLSAYEKELYLISFVVKKWQPYFLDQQVIIRKNQKALKYLLE